MDETQGSWTRGSCVPEEGSPFSDGAHGQPEGELALGTCDWRGEPLTDQKCEQMFP